MAELTYLEAIGDSLREEMRSDPSVICIGEDVGAFGGAFKVTEGFQEEFGRERVIDAPLAENAIIGAATGAAVEGMRPVCEMQFADFIACGFDQLVNVAAKLHYRQGVAVPIVVRLPSGGGFSGGPFHSQNPEAWFLQAPGLKVVAPATAADARGLLTSAIRDPNPVCFLEHKGLYRHVRDEVPAGDHTVAIGEARVARPGSAMSVIAYGSAVHLALRAAEELGEEIEVLDLRSLAPLDVEAIVATARRTRRVLIAHEATRSCGVGAEVAAVLGEHAFELLDAPVRRLTAPDVPIPFSPPLERAVLPQLEDMKRACRELLEHRAPARRRAPGGDADGGGALLEPDAQRSAPGERADAGSSGASIVAVTMPQMGISVAEGTIVEWSRQPGDRVAADESLCSVTTDKVDVEIPSPAAGRLTRVLAEEGATVAAGEPIAEIEADAAPAGGEPEAGGLVPAAEAGGERREPMSPMRRAIAEHMLASRRISAHCTTVVEVDMSAVARRRAELAAEAGGEGTAPTYLAFVAVAAAEALGEFPILNASIDGEDIVHHDGVDLGIAVALDDGLVVPVIRGAHDLELGPMATAIAAVAERAREGRLGPGETAGGTFTITNPGRFGALLATPIINQPQVAILDLEAVVRRPVAVAADGGEERIEVRPMAYLPLSWDHRALDGATAARFLARIRELLERGECG